MLQRNMQNDGLNGDRTCVLFVLLIIMEHIVINFVTVKKEIVNLQLVLPSFFFQLNISLWFALSKLFPS